MADWTTKPLSARAEIDLHPDLQSFPAQIRINRDAYSDSMRGCVLNEDEARELMHLLIEHFGGVYSTG